MAKQLKCTMKQSEGRKQEKFIVLGVGSKMGGWMQEEKRVVGNKCISVKMVAPWGSLTLLS